MQRARLVLLGLVVLSLTVLSVSGCSRRMIDFTMISSKDLGMTVPNDAKGTRVEGRDQIYWLFWIPLGVPNLKEATDRAIEAAGPGYDALIDGVVYSFSYWYVLSGTTGYKVVGTPIKSSMVTSLLDHDLDLAGHPILFHSSLGRSNEEAWARLMASTEGLPGSAETRTTQDAHGD